MMDLLHVALIYLISVTGGQIREGIKVLSKGWVFLFTVQSQLKGSSF